MKLNFIKTDRCPICGCNIIISESIEPDIDYKSLRTHSYGGQWEHRTFLCGKEVVYIPNFRSEELKGNCKNDPIYIARLQKIKDDKIKLKKFCEDENIDESIINNIKFYVD